MSLTATTKLNAINVLLTSIGEAPVNAEGSGLDEEAIASSILDEVSRAVQLIGWSWNTEDGYPLAKNLGGEVYLPTNALKVDFQNSKHIARGTRVYDKSNHTYIFTSDLKAKIIFGLGWEELPEAMRSYIMYRGGRVFQARQLSSQIIDQFTREDEQKAWVELVSSENEVGNHTIFQNTELSLMLNRSSSIPAIDYHAGTLGGIAFE
ncbi:hypothetical protein [Amphritea sp. HPY]|uniref:hypothetical protein n=1 Tax=Amphritea sp. HPY TaxID=3421652 RepID=UPI003D7CC566